MILIYLNSSRRNACYINLNTVGPQVYNLWVLVYGQRANIFETLAGTTNFGLVNGQANGLGRGSISTMCVSIHDQH